MICKARLRLQAGQAQGFPLLHTASLAAFPRLRNKSPYTPTHLTHPHICTHKQVSSDLTISAIRLCHSLFCSRPFKPIPSHVSHLSLPSPLSALSASHCLFILVLFSHGVLHQEEDIFNHLFFIDIKF